MLPLLRSTELEPAQGPHEHVNLCPQKAHKPVSAEKLSRTILSTTLFAGTNRRLESNHIGFLPTMEMALEAQEVVVVAAVEVGEGKGKRQRRKWW